MLKSKILSGILTFVRTKKSHLMKQLFEKYRFSLTRRDYVPAGKFGEWLLLRKSILPIHWPGG